MNTASNEVLFRGRRAVVLLAEDNDNDVELSRMAFERARYAVELHVVSDGVECLSFLRREGPYANAPLPDLILLDLQMPRMNGLGVLRALLEDEQLSHLPVVVLTTSSSERDVYSAYRLRCSGYLQKPVGFSQFLQLIEEMEKYWFSLVLLPPRILPGESHTSSKVGS